MKVIYIIDTLQTGGAETSLLEISSRLTRFRPVVCVVYGRTGSLRYQFEKKGIEIIDLNITSKFWWIEGVREFKKVVREVKPDLVHATLFKSEIITRIALRKSSIPQVGSFVNDSYSPHRYSQQSTSRNLKLDFVRFVDRVTAQWVPDFMSISKTIALTNSKALRINPNKITCIYRGRNIDKFHSSHPSIDQRPFIFLTVARLLKRKGYLELFKAARLLVDKGHQFLIRIAGDGNDALLFRDTVATLKIEGYVEFLGNRNDIPDLLAQSHCFVFPSHYEGQGGSLTEGMLAAKPIIASDIPVFREQITSHKTGLLFELFNIQQLSEQMEWVMQHYAEGIGMGAQAREVATERFNIDRTVLLHEEMYLRILGRTGKAIYS